MIVAMREHPSVVERGGLVRLVDAGLTVAEPAQDVRGRRVVGPAGEELGRVDALFVDARRRRVRYLRVAAGGVWGFGARHVLIPCRAVARVEPDAVVADPAGARAGSGYAPALRTERYWNDRHVLNWAPFWARPLLDPVLAPAAGGRAALWPGG
jgi:sporulation protein YlmC with PRC-barrel domain